MTDVLQLPALIAVPRSNRAVPSSQSARSRANTGDGEGHSTGRRPMPPPSRESTLAQLLNPAAIVSVSAWPCPHPPPPSRGIVTRASTTTGSALATLSGGDGVKPPRSAAPLVLEISAYIKRELRAIGQPQPKAEVSDAFPPAPISADRSLTVVVATPKSGREPAKFSATAVNTASNGEAASAVGSMERVRVYREAWSMLARHFTEYEDLMESIRREYDAALLRGEEHRRHAVELERELATARSYVHFIVEAETSALRKRALDAEIEAAKRTAEAAALRSDLAASIKRFNERQHEVEKALDDVGDAHQRNKLISDALRNESARQAQTAEVLKQLRKENEKLQAYGHIMEEQARDDQIVIEELKEKVALQEAAVAKLEVALAGAQAALPAYRLAAANASLPKPDSDGGPANPLAGSVRFLAVARAALSNSMMAPPAPAAPAPQAADAKTTVIQTNTTDRHIDDLESRLAVTAAALRQRNSELEAQRASVGNLQSKLTALTQKRGDRPQTPRPMWSSLSKVLPSFSPQSDETSETILSKLQLELERFKKRDRRETEAKALSRAIFTWLGEENLCESDLSNFSSTFVGLGNGPDVPALQRYHGRLRNKRLKKGHVEQLLNSFWAARQERRRAEGKEVIPVDVFAADWLRQITASPRDAVELAYNIMDVCAAHKYDTDCLLFHDIITGRICEEVFYDSQAALDQLQRMVKHSDRTNSGYVDRTHFFKLITRVYPGKSRGDVLRLRYALVASSYNDTRVNYLDLFQQDSDGDQTRFVELLRRQHVEESQELLTDIEEQLRSMCDENGCVNMLKCKLACHAVDPAAPEQFITKILACGFRMPEEQVELAELSTACPFVEFSRRVRIGALVRRFSPKDAENADVGAVEEDDEEMGTEVFEDPL